MPIISGVVVGVGGRKNIFSKDGALAKEGRSASNVGLYTSSSSSLCSRATVRSSGGSEYHHYYQRRQECRRFAVVAAA